MSNSVEAVLAEYEEYLGIYRGETQDVLKLLFQKIRAAYKPEPKYREAITATTESGRTIVVEPGRAVFIPHGDRIMCVSRTPEVR